jgi:hypothetical protein
MSEARSAEKVEPAAVGGWPHSVARGASNAIPVVLRIYIGLSLLYAASIAYGAFDGYALPTAAIFSLFPNGGILAASEQSFAPILLAVAAVGAALTWAVKLGVIEAPLTLRNEIASTRFFLRYFLLPIFLMMVWAMSSGGWSGRIVPGFWNYTSLAGLLPYSDAADHFFGPLQQVLTGSWSVFSSRRPFAASFRELTMALAGFSYVWTLLVQAILLSAALFAAARSIVLWRGLWSGLAFCAFVFILVHPFLGDVLSEPIGLVWGLLAVMFAVDAMRFQKREYAFLSLIALTVAELVRMGSMFTVPAFVLWIALAFGNTIRERLILFAEALALVVALLGAQALCSALYGNTGAVIGGNFAFTLCGLAVGGEWSACLELYKQDLSRLTTEREQAAFLYSKSIEIISHNPTKLIGGLIWNAWTFLKGIPNFMMAGYWNTNKVLPKWTVLAFLPGLIFYLRRNRAHGEASFWLLMFASMTASAMIIMRDDGFRVLFVTWPFVALFFSLAFAPPAAVPPPAGTPAQLSIRGGALLISLMVCAIVVAPGIIRIWPGKELQGLARTANSPGTKQDIVIGRTLTGFVVVPDADPLPKSVPAIHATDFAYLVEQTGMETYYGKFLDAAMKQLPFAFVAGTRVTDAGYLYYLAPVKIFTDGPASTWRLTVADNLHNSFVHDVSTVQAVR